MINKSKAIGSKYSIGAICSIVGYSRQGYYKAKKELEAKFNKKEMIIKTVKKIRTRQSKVGGKKLYKMLKNDGIEIGMGRDSFFDLLRENNLLIKKKKKYAYTTNSKHYLYKYKNLAKDKVLDGVEQVLVSDITYIDTLEGFGYLSLITDKYSRKILGYHLSKSLGIEGCIKALKMAIRGLKKTEHIIHHSDRGVQYCSHAYVGILLKNKMLPSMTEIDHVYENALAERVNGILKDEFLLGEKLRSFKLAEIMVKEAIEIYNNERLHMAIDYLTPNQRHNQLVA